MPNSDFLHDLQDAASRRFLLYSFQNSFVTPYAKDTHGGEQITEFNLNASLNALLKREVNLASFAESLASDINEQFGSPVEVDSSTGATEMVGPGLNSFLDPQLHDKNLWVYLAYATGVRDLDDFSLAMVDGKLTISSGVALVSGYYIEADCEVQIDSTDVIRNSEIADVVNNPGQNKKNPCLTKFVKLGVQHTSPVDGLRHSDRLLPPYNDNGIYQGVVIVIDGALPRPNELLLGTVTRDTLGRFLVVDNPAKTRMIPLDGVQGAENYHDLLSSIDDEHTYGIKHGSTDGSPDGAVTNLRVIDPWLWLHSGSNLALLLRSVSTNAETAGAAVDEPTRGLIVSDETPYTEDDPVVDNFNCLQRIDANTGTQFARMSWHQAQTPPKSGADMVDHRALYFPYAKAVKNNSFLTLQEMRSPSHDKSVGKPFYDIATYPCLNGLNGTDGLMTYQQLAMLEMVFQDYVHRQEAGETARGKMFGPFLSLSDAKEWFQTHRPVVNVGDYFWVINDTAEAGGTEATPNSDTTYELHNIVTNYGTVTGTVTGTAKQSSLLVPVTGTGTGTAHKVGEPDVEYEFEDIDISGDGKGTINATVKGTVSGTLNSFTQNVASRYVCRYRDDATDEGIWKFAHGITVEPTHDDNFPDDPFKFLPITLDNYIILDGEGGSQSFSDVPASEYDTHPLQNVLFAVESVERGFAIPATPNVYGLVKTGPGSNLYDVVTDPTSQRLRITEALLGFIKGGGFQNQQSASSEIQIDPGMDLTPYQYCRYPNGITFKMVGSASEWRAALDTTGLLAHIRGAVVLDFSEVIEDGKRSDGLLLRLEDIDYLTLIGDNEVVGDPANPTHPSTETMMFGVNHCVVNSSFFTNIGEWKYSQFISGSNTLELELPWMLVENVFTNTVDNSMSCKFASVTMGPNGISSATLDVWIKHRGWDDYGGGLDRMWASSGYIKFPPMFFEQSVGADGELTSDINKKTIQRIPDNLNLKVSGTSGVHQAWDANNTEFVPSGNLLASMNWEYNGNPSSAKTQGGKVYLNLYMKNTAPDVLKQGISGLRFRAEVQVIRLDNNAMSASVPYEQLYEAIPTSLK